MKFRTLISFSVILHMATILVGGEPSAKPVLYLETGFHTNSLASIDTAADGTVLGVSLDKPVDPTLNRTHWSLP